MEYLKFVHINDKDNAIISLFEVQEGEIITLPDGSSITVQERIPPSHKIAMKDFQKGDPIIKYGEEIGCASQLILKGGWIHAHNIQGSQDFADAVEQGLREGGAR